MKEMKKEYLAPKTEEVELALEKCVLQALSDPLNALTAPEDYGNGGEGGVKSLQEYHSLIK